MSALKAYTKEQTIEMMMVETQNELTKCEIMEQIYQRQRLKGNQVDIMMGQNQTRIRSLKQALTDLQEIGKVAT